jgi:pimeloyl-ACP methyl ester carboxylesterase
MHPITRYARSGGIHIAYQTVGEGPLDVVFMPGFVSHVEVFWEDPHMARWFRRLSSFSRVILFDKRGTGLSDPVEALPGMDVRMDDFRAVMDAVGVERASLLGISEGGPLAGLFAATHPDRCQSPVFFGAFANFSSWMTEEDLRHFFEYVDNAWGSEAFVDRACPSASGDPAFREWAGKFERPGASPGALKRLMHMNSQIDITDVLPSIQAPTLVMHRTDELMVRVEGSRTLAERIPNARYIELPGRDHLPWIGEDSEFVIGTIEEFLTGTKSVPPSDRVLATVIFTDIVASTERAEKLGGPGRAVRPARFVRPPSCPWPPGSPPKCGLGSPASGCRRRRAGAAHPGSH